MGRFKNYISFFLLLLFARVLVPETSMLALHSHKHTEDVQQKMEAGFKLEKKHSHCHTDNFFNTPFSPASAVRLNPQIVTFSDSYSTSYCGVWKFTFPNNTDLRGPPIA